MHGKFQFKASSRVLKHSQEVKSAGEAIRTLPDFQWRSFSVSYENICHTLHRDGTYEISESGEVVYGDKIPYTTNERGIHFLFDEIMQIFD